MRALDTLDDQFARMAAALLALLDAHGTDEHGRCSLCPPSRSEEGPACLVLATVYEHLKQPLTLLWWHQFHRRGERMSIDEVGAWIERSGIGQSWAGEALAEGPEE